jgi:hypothetical protein
MTPNRQGLSTYQQNDMSTWLFGLPTNDTKWFWWLMKWWFDYKKQNFLVFLSVVFNVCVYHEEIWVVQKWNEGRRSLLFSTRKAGEESVRFKIHKVENRLESVLGSGVRIIKLAMQVIPSIDFCWIHVVTNFKFLKASLHFGW